MSEKCLRCGGTGLDPGYYRHGPEAREAHATAKALYWQQMRSKVEELRARGEQVQSSDFLAVRGEVYNSMQQLLAYHNADRMLRDEPNLTMMEFDPWGDHSVTEDQIRRAFTISPARRAAATRLFGVTW